MRLANEDFVICEHKPIMALFNNFHSTKIIFMESTKPISVIQHYIVNKVEDDFSDPASLTTGICHRCGYVEVTGYRDHYHYSLVSDQETEKISQK